MEDCFEGLVSGTSFTFNVSVLGLKHVLFKQFVIMFISVGSLVCRTGWGITWTTAEWDDALIVDTVWWEIEWGFNEKKWYCYEKLGI